MEITLQWNGKTYKADLSAPLDISIPLKAWPEQPNCFFAPPYEASPLISGDFTGSVAEGAPVNFFNVRLNPHGNGTHTECVGHITPAQESIQETLRDYHSIAEVISVFPEKLDNGDRVITEEHLESAIQQKDIESLIIRTLPNTPEKRFTKYSGTNPPYMTERAMTYLNKLDIRHLLVDLPSVDREEDGGKLLAHKEFWQVSGKVRNDRTITEMICVDNYIRDGLYLLNIQIAGFDLDVSPSKPVIYRLENA